MLRQLRALTRTIPQWNADAIAVYGLARGAGWVAGAASDQGFEGVACVDDVARAAHLYCELFSRGGDRNLILEARRLLRFVKRMQADDGRFYNFIIDWEGTVNRTGPTSYLGGFYWTARAIRALVQGYIVLGDNDYKVCALKAIESVDEYEVDKRLDALATLVLSLLSLYESIGDRSLRRAVLNYADRIAECRDGDRLLDSPAVSENHLWAHEQEVALLEVGRRLRRPSLIDLGARSALAVFLPVAEQGFELPHVCPYEVSCAARGLWIVGRQVRNQRLVEAAWRAQAWFFGRNPAMTAVFDVSREAFLDGVENGRVSADSGAESNIEGALCFTMMTG